MSGFRIAGVALWVASAGFASPVHAVPAEVPGVERSQIASHTPKAQNLLRVWLIGIGQGDSILIELPPELSVAMGNPADDPVNVLIDGGGMPKSDDKRARIFLHKRYAHPSIEYMVLTHQDQDHIAGLTQVLKDADISVERIYHSGLGAFRVGSTRSLGKFDAQGNLTAPFILKDLTGLKAAANANRLASEFKPFAAAVVGKSIERFGQACFKACPDLDARLTRPMSGTNPSLKIQTLWPAAAPRRYTANWALNTNGNSVIFRMDYGDFSMLFTGDLNKNASAEFLAELKAEGLEDRLHVDVLKAAHHGSKHISDDFLKHPQLQPVVSVASMGSSGFRMGKAYHHPDDGTIRALGGFERFDSTYIEEKSFAWEGMTASKLNAMIEDTHVLIETDGVRFRVVEVRRDTDSLQIDPVSAVAPGNGTLWIEAKD